MKANQQKYFRTTNVENFLVELLNFTQAEEGVVDAVGFEVAAHGGCFGAIWAEQNQPKFQAAERDEQLLIGL